MNSKFTPHQNIEGYISTRPLPSTEELKIYYAENYYQNPKSTTYQKEYSSLDLDYKFLKSKALIYAINAFKKLKGNAFLDIGAGEGFLLNEAKTMGSIVTGLDFSDFGVNKFFPHLMPDHIKGDVFDSLSMLINLGKKYSVCASTNVLEHVLNPDLFLEKIKKLLEPDGVIAITVPNDYSDIQLLAKKEGYIDNEFWFVPPDHLNYFNTNSLVNFLSSKKFEIIDAFSDFPIDLFLLHSGSNYIADKKNGFEANRARMQHDVLLAEKYGLNGYLDYYRAMFKIGLGRDITVIARMLKE